MGKQNKKIGNWELKKMGDIFQIERGGSPRPIEDYITNDSNGLNWIKIGDTKGAVKYITSTKEKIKSEGLKKTRMVYEDDFLLSNSMSFGRPYIMKTSGCIHDGWLVIRKNKDVNNDFLYYVLSSNSVYAQFSNLAKGSTVKNLNIEAVKQVNIPIPDITTQHLIVSKIEELFSELDKGIESLQTALAQLKTYRQAVLKWAFEGKLTNPNVKEGELPKGWKWVKLLDVSNLITKGASPKWQGINYVVDPSQVLFVTSENVRENYIDVSSPKYLELGFNEKQKRSILQKGDVLLNIVGASIGRAAIYNLEHNANVNQAVAIIRLKDEVVNKFVSYFLNSNKALSYYNLNKVDVARANLSLADVGNIHIGLPDLREQKQIIQEIESRLSVADKMEETITQSLQQAEVLKQSILKQAFEGRLVKAEDLPKEENLHIGEDSELTLALLVQIIEGEMKINYGEVVLQKTVFNCSILQPGFIKAYDFANSNYGTYSMKLRDDLKSNRYLEKKTIKEKIVFTVKEEYKLKIDSLIQNKEGQKIIDALKIILSIYKSSFINKKTERIELFNTVLKCIIDTQSSEITAILKAMKKWNTPKTEFKNKSEKFTEKETKECLQFIIEKKWDKKLI